MQTRRLFEIAPGALPATSALQVGNKAWNLMRMAAAGLPVPPGFVLPANWARRVRAKSPAVPVLTETLRDGIARLEKLTGLGFGSRRRPLLVSVRSGSAVSMPGMMETVLDIGLTPVSAEGLIGMTGNPRLAWDSYRRLIQGYAEVVKGLPAGPFEELVAGAVAKDGAESDRDLDFRALRSLVHDMAALYRDLAAEPFPEDPFEQLAHATTAVFRSWHAPKAAAYRKINHIDDSIGTAVTVQAMVFGNGGGASGAGVGFTRNPATGEKELYLDFRFNAQGEDVVAGRHRTMDCERLRRSRLRDLETNAGDWSDPRNDLPRCPGFRVHRAERRVVPASGARRQADRLGRSPHGGGPCRRGNDRTRGGVTQTEARERRGHREDPFRRQAPRNRWRAQRPRRSASSQG